MYCINKRNRRFTCALRTVRRKAILPAPCSRVLLCHRNKQWMLPAWRGERLHWLSGNVAMHGDCSVSCGALLEQSLCTSVPQFATLSVVDHAEISPCFARRIEATSTHHAVLHTALTVIRCGWQRAHPKTRRKKNDRNTLLVGLRFLSRSRADQLDIVDFDPL